MKIESLMHVPAAELLAMAEAASVRERANRAEASVFRPSRLLVLRTLVGLK